MHMQKIPIREINRFSVFVKGKNTREYENLLVWQQWFTKRGIPSVVAVTNSGYALYREGLIEVDIKDENLTRIVNR